jgi:hypothetical protein
MLDRDHIEDEDAYQETAEGDFEYDAEKELDFGWVSSVPEPAEGLYEGLEHSLEGVLDDAEAENDPFVEDLLVSEDDVTSQGRVDFDFDNFYVSNDGDRADEQ